MNKKMQATGILFFSLLAGFCNGFLGAGGGIILVLGLGLLCPDLFYDKRDLYANSQAVMVPISALSSILYFWRRTGISASLSTYTIPAIIGGLVGGTLLSHLRVNTVKIIFALIVIVSGIRMIVG